MQRPPGHISIRSGRLLIAFPYDGRLVSEVRGIPGRLWDQVDKLWVAPLSSVTPVRAFATRNGLTISDQVAALPDQVADTRPVVDFTGQWFVFSFESDTHKLAALKAMGARRDAGARAWKAPRRKNVEALTWALAYDARITDRAEHALVGARLTLSLAEASHAHDAEYEVEGLGGELRGFQKAAVAYGMRVRRTFIADEQGLGKTVEALAILEAAKAFPALIVTPAGHVRTNWAREAAFWLPNRTVEVIEGGPPRALTADVTIIGYASVSRWLGNIPQDLPALVLDESHKVKNPRAQRSMALVAAGAKVASDGIALALSGTPVPNRAEEMLTQLEVIGRLIDFGGPKSFKLLAKDPIALNRRLRGTCFIRRLKSEVWDEMPEKLIVPVVVEGDPQIMAEYRKAEADIVRYLADRARALALEAGEDPLDADAAGWKARLRASAAENFVAFGVLRQLAARAKMAEAFEWVDNFLEGGNKLVVFGIHIPIVGAMSDRYGPDIRIQGDVDAVARAKAVDAFQSDPATKVLCSSIAAGGVGITLTAASDVLLVEQGWTPADLDQAVDRCHRIGQRDSVTGWVMITKDTVDEDIYALVEKKRVHVDAVVDGVEGKETASVIGDLAVLLAERGLAA
jgi:SWI/SNF-related matrix-associated actin-dependent regulator of chromatin subfamily A-like protein 1